MSDLVLLSDVKAYAGINSNTQDASISYLIPKVSLYIKNYCGRTLVEYYTTPKVEVFNGGNPEIFLKEAPIRVVSAVEYSQDYGKSYSPLVEFEDYVVDRELEAIAMIKFSVLPKSLNAFKVTYTGGYATVPEDLKLAVVDLIQYYMRSDMAVKSTRTPGSSSTQVEYVMNATLPSHIRRVLDAYRLDL